MFEPAADPSPTRAAHPPMAWRSAGNARIYPRGAIDGRTRRGKRLRDLVREFSAPLGEFGRLSAADQAMVLQAATKVLELEALRDALARGEPIDSNGSVRLTNSLDRLLKRLEARQKQAKAAPAETLAAYLARREAERAAERERQRGEEAAPPPSMQLGKTGDVPDATAGPSEGDEADDGEEARG